ncbi:MAG: class I SAM-dependent methyltransferase [Snowella sp.]|nr:class I SAM-dependent methyltransferase [Snowella sp.]
MQNNHWKDLLRDYGDKDLETKKSWYSPVADRYNRVRPRYCQEMIIRVLEVAQLPQKAKILELGSGPAIATLPFARRGFFLVSLEPSEAAYHLAKQNCVEFANVEIKNLTFEEWEVPDVKFDAVLAATSWHWLSPETAYPKAYEAMKNNGSLILLWNTPPQPSYEIYLILKDIYQNIAPNIPLYARYQSAEEHQEIFEKFSKDILASGYFHQLVYENVNHEVTYSITDYLDLLSTLSAYRCSINYGKPLPCLNARFLSE